MEFKSPVQPALSAVASLRKDIGARIGKEGGNLNRYYLSRLDVIETTLLQIEPLGNMLNLVNHQTEVAVQSFRALARVPLNLPPTNDTGDDGTSETKGQ